MVGCGTMGRALLDGWQLPPGHVVVIAPSETTRQRAAADYGAACFSSLAEMPAHIHPAMILLAVKPLHLAAVLSDLSARPTLTEGGVVSVAAGHNLAFYEQVLGPTVPLVRAMPNTPCAVRLGITGCIGNEAAQESLAPRVSACFERLGLCLWLKNEMQMHGFTSLCGCGPAFLFELLDQLAQQSMKAGLPQDYALPIVAQLVRGALALAEHSKENLSQLRDSVASRGGMTARGLEIWSNPQNGVGSLLEQTLEAATRRSLEMMNES